MIMYFCGDPDSWDMRSLMIGMMGGMMGGMGGGWVADGRRYGGGWVAWVVGCVGAADRSAVGLTRPAADAKFADAVGESHRAWMRKRAESSREG